MITITGNILDMFDDDMVSHGLIEQCLKQVNTDSYFSNKLLLKDTLKELLEAYNVEIGTAQLKTSDYIEFVAWNGSVDERVNRALDAVSTANGPDKEFAYWLCLRENVDRFEEHDE